MVPCFPNGLHLMSAAGIVQLGHGLGTQGVEVARMLGLHIS